METGEIIKVLRESKGLTQQQLAQVVGAKSYTTITKWESGDNSPKGKDIKLLSKFFNVSSDYILGLEEYDLLIPKESQYKYYPVPISAGLPTDVEAITETNTETIVIPDILMGKWSGTKDVIMLRVNGDSMNRIIPHNSLIAIKIVEFCQLKDNDIVVFSNENDYSVKRFFNDTKNERFIFRPDSNDSRFVDYIVTYQDAHNLKLHGKVVIYIVEQD